MALALVGPRGLQHLEHLRHGLRPPELHPGVELEFQAVEQEVAQFLSQSPPLPLAPSAPVPAQQEEGEEVDVLEVEERELQGRPRHVRLWGHTYVSSTVGGGRGGPQKTEERNEVA